MSDSEEHVCKDCKLPCNHRFPRCYTCNLTYQSTLIRKPQMKREEKIKKVKQVTFMFDLDEE